MSERNLLIVGTSGYGNVGDDAIALAIARLLRQVDPDCGVTILSGSPREVTRMLGFPAQDLSWSSPFNAAKLIGLIRRSDAVLIGGGGLLQDIQPHFYRAYLLTVLAAAAVKKPAMIYAAGVYPPRTSVFRGMLRIALRRAAVITVRDEFSAAALKEAGIRRRVTVTADPAITLEPPLWPSLPHDDAIPTIGVSLRPWYHLPTCPPGDHERLVKHLAACLDAVVEATNGQLLLLPMQHGGVDDDWRMQKRVLARMSHLDSVATYSSRRPLEVLGAIAGCDLIIGMRLHSNVLAAAAGVPSIGLAYDPKVGAFMKSLGCEDHIVELEDLRPETLADKATLVLRAREQIVRRIEQGRRRLVEQAWECAAAAVRLAGAQPLSVTSPSVTEEESTHAA